MPLGKGPKLRGLKKKDAAVNEAPREPSNELDDGLTEVRGQNISERVHQVISEPEDEAMQISKRIQVALKGNDQDLLVKLVTELGESTREFKAAIPGWLAFLEKVRNDRVFVHNFYEKLDDVRSSKEEKIAALSLSFDTQDAEIVPYLERLMAAQGEKLESVIFRYTETIIELFKAHSNNPGIKALHDKLLVYLKVTVSKFFLDPTTIQDNAISRNSIYALVGFAHLYPRDPNLLAIAGIIVKGCEALPDQNLWGSIADYMAALQYEPALDLLQKMYLSAYKDPGIEKSLLILGLTQVQIHALSSVKIEHDIETALQRTENVTVVGLLRQHKSLKPLVFDEAKFLGHPNIAQAWMTINHPNLAAAIIRELSNCPLIKDRVDHVLNETIGLRLKKVNRETLKYFSDEIIDAVIAVVASAKNVRPELLDLLQKAQYGGDFKLRYVRRELSDLSLGDKTGDCTAKGSINFENSVMWLANPAYQIIKISKGGRFLGKINVALAVIDGARAIYVDALEFNPQAVEGKPYYEDAKAGFEEVLKFCKKLATAMGCDFYALIRSNSSKANDILSRHGLKENQNKKRSVQLVVPYADISRVLAAGGYLGSYKLYYQILDEPLSFKDKPTNVLELKNLAAVEHEILNPAQVADPEIAEKMRARDFLEAAQLILEREEWIATLLKIYNLPASMKISPGFLVLRMEKIFSGEAKGSQFLAKRFFIDAVAFPKLSMP